VVDLVEAFAANWVRAGGSLEATARPVAILAPVAGDANVRVIATGPTESDLFRLDTLVAAAAREFLWLTDAYFVATNNYVQALAAAARDGVDVRLLLPGTSDLPLVRALSVIGYRPLLEAGVRIFEWNGTMLHAKTAVADGTWSRIGSSNVNPLSWWGNWELDLAIEHDSVAADVAEMFLRDLKHSTEIVLDIRQRVARTKHPERPTRRRQRRRTRRAVAGAVGLGSTMRAALTNRRTLTPTEARVLAVGAVLLSALGWIALVYPRAVAWPLGIIAFSAALTVLLRAARLFLRARSAREQSRTR
jgi:cardiolipin synthase